MTKKEFIIQQIAPYWQNPSTCAIINRSCRYKLSDGRMCVAGKNMRCPSMWEGYGTVRQILITRSQAEVFIPEVVGKLTAEEWGLVQELHDCIATFGTGSIDAGVDDLLLKLDLYFDIRIKREELDNYQIAVT